MKFAETVTFGGSGLDRAAGLRGDEKALATLIAQGQAETLLFWRGKPLLADGALDRLARLPMQHPVPAGAGMPPVLLGREEDGRLVFAHDISGWVPGALDEAALGSFLDASEQSHPDLPGGTVFAELRRVMARLSPRDAEMAAAARAITGWHVSHRFCACCGEESRMAQSGWQRNCPACGGQHFPRTDPVVIMLVTHGNAVLVGRSHGWPEGMYSLLAGFVEPGETIEAAVRREVHEETCVQVGAVSYLASQPWAFPSSLMVGCRAEALGREIVIDKNEIEDAVWVGREEMLTVFSGQHRRFLPPRNGAIAQFLLRNWLADRLD